MRTDRITMADAIDRLIREICAEDGHDEDQAERLANFAVSKLDSPAYICPADLLATMKYMSAQIAAARRRIEAEHRACGNCGKAPTHDYRRVNGRDRPVRVIAEELIREDREGWTILRSGKPL